MKRTFVVRRIWILLFAALLPVVSSVHAYAQGSQPAAPQFAPTVRTAVVPDTIHVGDVITAAVRVTVPTGANVSFPDSLVLPMDMENAGGPVVKADTTPTGIQMTVTYPLAAWRVGAYEIPAIPFTVNGTAMNATFADSVRVTTVLPPDTTGIQPKPLKSVMGETRVWWPWILALVLLLLLVLLYWLSRRRHHDVELPVVPPRPAREVALEKLDTARTAGLVERGEFKQFYSDVSDALREYIGAVDPILSTDLTTSEMAGRIRARGVDSAAAEMLTLLGAADLVKFARRRPQAAEAQDEWMRVRRWVADAKWPPAHPDSEVDGNAPGAQVAA